MFNAQDQRRADTSCDHQSIAIPVRWILMLECLSLDSALSFDVVNHFYAFLEILI